MACRNALSVLPLPVGATTSACLPAAIASHAPAPGGRAQTFGDDEASWARALSIRDFRHIYDPSRTSRFPTQAALVWDDANLYIAFDSTDPDPWGTMTQRDDRLWEEEVIEVFLDPDGDGLNYAELEVSPNNVVVDLLIPRPRADVNESLRWDIDGLRTAVAHRPGAWTVEIAIPWAGLGATGLAQCAELNWQLRGLADKRQVSEVLGEIRGVVELPRMHFHRGDLRAEFPVAHRGQLGDEVDGDRAGFVRRLDDAALLDQQALVAEAGEIAEHVVERNEREPEREAAQSEAEQLERQQAETAQVVEFKIADLELRRIDQRAPNAFPYPGP